MKTPYEGGHRTSGMIRKATKPGTEYQVERQFNNAQNPCVNLENPGAQRQMQNGESMTIQDDEVQAADNETALLNKMNDKIKKETGTDMHEDDEKKIHPRCVKGVEEVIDLTVGVKSTVIGLFDKDKGKIMDQAQQVINEDIPMPAAIPEAVVKEAEKKKKIEESKQKELNDMMADTSINVDDE